MTVRPLMKMRVRGPYGRIDGYEAVRYARTYGVPICKYNEPELEEKRNDLTPSQAEGVISDRGPWVIYVDAMRGYAIETQRTGRWTSMGLTDDPRANFFGDEEAATEAIEELRGLGPDWLARQYRIVAVSVKRRKIVPVTQGKELYTAYLDGGEGGVKTFEAADDNAAIEQAQKWADGRGRPVKRRTYRLRLMRRWRKSDGWADPEYRLQNRLARQRGDPMYWEGEAVAICDRKVEGASGSGTMRISHSRKR